MKSKMRIALDVLCRGLPPQFKAILKYARNLKFEEDPDYEMIQRLLNEVEVSEESMQFDWEAKNEETSRNTTFGHLVAAQKRRHSINLDKQKVDNINVQRRESIFDIKSGRVLRHDSMMANLSIHKGDESGTAKAQLGFRYYLDHNNIEI